MAVTVAQVSRSIVSCVLLAVMTIRLAIRRRRLPNGRTCPTIPRLSTHMCPALHPVCHPRLASSKAIATQLHRKRTSGTSPTAFQSTMTPLSWMAWAASPPRRSNTQASSVFHLAPRSSVLFAASLALTSSLVHRDRPACSTSRPSSRAWPGGECPAPPGRSAGAGCAFRLSRRSRRTSTRSSGTFVSGSRCDL